MASVLSAKDPNVIFEAAPRKQVKRFRPSGWLSDWCCVAIVMCNYAQLKIRFFMTDWQSYTATVANHTVVGDLRVHRAVHSPQLNNQRDVFVWLPPSYHTSNQRYPVIYMHDGQNIFDAHTSYAGEWYVDETLTSISREGYEAIAVGLPNTGAERHIEYNPYDTYRAQGRGDTYINFITDTVKPMVDEAFRTRPGADTTAIGGSSMGGLISLHAFLTRRDVFGLCLAMSPSFWFGASSLLDLVETCADGTGKIYLDIGTAEGAKIRNHAHDAADGDDASQNTFVRGIRYLRDALYHQGYQDETLRYIEENGAEHNEAAWARRLPNALRFLLPQITQ